MSEKTKTYVKSCFWRSLKTFCEATLACITLGTPIFNIDWIQALAIGATAGVYALLSCIVKTPDEVKLTEKLETIGKDYE